MYEFEGPFQTVESLEDESGVYAVLCVYADKIDLVDVGQSSRVRTCVKNCERKECWKQNCPGVLKYAIYYEGNGTEHLAFDVVKDVKANYYLICGG